MSELPIGGHVSDAPTTGWGLPGNSQRFHYFGDDGRSLCGKWGFYGGPWWTANSVSDEACAACKRKRDTQLKRLANPNGGRE